MSYPVVGARTALLVLFVFGSAPALAGPYSDDMAKCLIRSTSQADRNLLVQWMFAAASLHPAVKSVTAVSEQQRTELNKRTANLIEKLLTASCRKETQEAVKYEGPNTIEASFEVLGQVAGRELFADPSVAASLTDFAKHVDQKKMKALFASKTAGD